MDNVIIEKTITINLSNPPKVMVAAIGVTGEDKYRAMIALFAHLRKEIPDPEQLDVMVFSALEDSKRISLTDRR